IAIDRSFDDSRLNGKKWKNIRQDTTLARAFWDYVIPVEFMNLSEETTFIKDVFDRLNRNSRRLVEQELRHAKYDGWFITFVEREAELPDWEKIGVVTTARVRRMSDVQFLSELLIVLLKGTVGGFDQEEIDNYYALYENPSETVENFDEDAIRHDFGLAKEYLMRLEEDNNTVTRYSKDATNLYSLWSIIALNLSSLPDVTSFARKYRLFMDEVNKYKSKDFMASVLDQKEAPVYSNSLNYYRNSIGARTEGPQREERHSILMPIIFS
ncbi:MAG: hypothetical protein ABSA18_17425, partial [Dehalococcoidia bacterium]